MQSPPSKSKEGSGGTHSPLPLPPPPPSARKKAQAKLHSDDSKETVTDERPVRLSTNDSVSKSSAAVGPSSATKRKKTVTVLPSPAKNAVKDSAAKAKGMATPKPSPGRARTSAAMGMLQLTTTDARKNHGSASVMRSPLLEGPSTLGDICNILLRCLGNQQSLVEARKFAKDIKADVDRLEELSQVLQLLRVMNGHTWFGVCSLSLAIQSIWESNKYESAPLLTQNRAACVTVAELTPIVVSALVRNFGLSPAPTSQNWTLDSIIKWICEPGAVKLPAPRAALLGVLHELVSILESLGMVRMKNVGLTLDEYEYVWVGLPGIVQPQRSQAATPNIDMLSHKRNQQQQPSMNSVVMPPPTSRGFLSNITPVDHVNKPMATPKSVVEGRRTSRAEARNAARAGLKIRPFDSAMSSGSGGSHGSEVKTNNATLGLGVGGSGSSIAAFSSGRGAGGSDMKPCNQSLMTSPPLENQNSNVMRSGGSAMSFSRGHGSGGITVRVTQSEPVTSAGGGGDGEFVVAGRSRSSSRRNSIEKEKAPGSAGCGIQELVGAAVQASTGDNDNDGVRGEANGSISQSGMQCAVSDGATDGGQEMEDENERMPSRESGENVHSYTSFTFTQRGFTQTPPTARVDDDPRFNGLNDNDDELDDDEGQSQCTAPMFRSSSRMSNGSISGAANVAGVTQVGEGRSGGGDGDGVFRASPYYCDPLPVGSAELNGRSNGAVKVSDSTAAALTRAIVRASSLSSSPVALPTSSQSANSSAHQYMQQQRQPAPVVSVAAAGLVPLEATGCTFSEMPLPSEMLAYQTRCMKELMKHYLIHYKRKYPNWVQQETEALKRRNINLQFPHMGQSHLIQPTHSNTRPHQGHASTPAPAVNSGSSTRSLPTQGTRLGELQHVVKEEQKRRDFSRTNSIESSRFGRSLSAPGSTSTSTASAQPKLVQTVAMRSASRSTSPIAHLMSSQDSAASLGTTWMNSNEHSRDSFRDGVTASQEMDQHVTGSSSGIPPPLVRPMSTMSTPYHNTHDDNHGLDDQLHAHSLLQFASPLARGGILASPYMPNSALAAPMAPMSAASFSTGSFGGRSSALRGSGGGGGGLHSQGQQLQRQLAALANDESVEMPSMEHTTMFPSTVKKHKTKKRRIISNDDENAEDSDAHSEEKENEHTTNSTSEDGSPRLFHHKVRQTASESERQPQQSPKKRNLQRAMLSSPLENYLDDDANKSNGAWSAYSAANDGH